MEFSDNYLDKMLSSAIDYYQHQNIGEKEIPLKLDSLESAISIFQNSLRNEAHRTMSETTTGSEPILHAVNLNSGTPGIITKIDPSKEKVSIYTNNDLIPEKSKKKKRKYKTLEQLEKIAEQKYELLQKKKIEKEHQLKQKKEEQEDRQTLKDTHKQVKEKKKQLEKLEKEVNNLELEKKDKRGKIDSITNDPDKSDKYQKTVDRLQKSLANLQEKESSKRELQQQYKMEQDEHRKQIENLDQKKEQRQQEKLIKRQQQAQLKEERRIKRLEKENLKKQTQDSLTEPTEEDKEDDPFTDNQEEDSSSNVEKEQSKKKKKPPAKKISSLEPSEIMDELYDCLNSFKSDDSDNHQSLSTPLNEITLYPSPIPFERHLSSLNLCNPNPVLLPTLLYGSNKFGSDHLKLIHGPPGTGKTYRLILELKNILEINSREKVLLCAPSNIGVINMYNRAVSMGVHGCLVLSSNKLPDNFKLPEKPGKDNIIFTTISMRFGSILNKMKFSTIIIDEACQCQEAWTWGLLRNEVSKVILAGDPQQLPALVSDIGQKYQYERSLMTRLIDLGVSSELLSVQRRMHPDIVSFSNNCFYEGKLTSNYTPFSENNQFLPIQIINVNGQEKSRGTSFYNLEEVNKVIEIEENLKKYFKEVVVISPYKEHCQLLKQKNKNLQVHTIDSFQGKEAEAIILTTVRTGNQTGFWNDYRRLNVGMTRAKHALRIIGKISTWSSSNGPLKKLLEFYQNNTNSNKILIQ